MSLDSTIADVAIVHDYCTQRGGAERVALDLLDCFPGATLYTSLYDPPSTFPEFAGHHVVRTPLDRVSILRGHHRLAYPLLAPAFGHLRVDCALAICSSSGWAHGAHASGKKIVYCHTPARWLYQTERYLGAQHRWARLPIEVTALPLRRWDQRAAHSANRYLVNSTVVRARVAAAYGIDATVLAPPAGLDVEGPSDAVAGLDEGFLLCISRLLEYKNVDAVVDAFRQLPDRQLVVAGTGPRLQALKNSAPSNVILLGSVSEAQLRWLYRSCAGVIAASYEDFGLTPIEGYSFGKPVAALRWGGYLDTVREGETGVFFDEPLADNIATGVRELVAADVRESDIQQQAERFSKSRFVDQMRSIAKEELDAG